MNLAPLTVDIHEYAAMRLVSVSVSCIKQYFVLRKQNPIGTEEADEPHYILWNFMKLALSYKKIDQNVQLVYAMVYHQVDFQRLFNDNGNFFLTVVETSNIKVWFHHGEQFSTICKLPGTAPYCTLTLPNVKTWKGHNKSILNAPWGNSGQMT